MNKKILIPLLLLSIVILIGAACDQENKSPGNAEELSTELTSLAPQEKAQLYFGPLKSIEFKVEAIVEGYEKVVRYRAKDLGEGNADIRVDIETEVQPTGDLIIYKYILLGSQGKGWEYSGYTGNWELMEEEDFKTQWDHRYSQLEFYAEEMTKDGQIIHYTFEPDVEEEVRAYDIKVDPDFPEEIFQPEI